MRKSLLFRIAAPYVFLIIILVSSLGIYLTFFVKNTYAASLEQQLLIEANLLSDQINQFIIDDDYGHDFIDLIDRNASIMNARITIIDKSGDVIIDTEAENDQLENHNNRPEVLEAYESGYGSDIRLSESINEEYFYVAVPIYDSDERIEAISRVSVPISSFSKKVSALQITILTTSILTIFIAIFLAFLITKRTLDPLRRLNNAITDLEIDETFIEKSDEQKDEIEKISEYIWQLAAKLKNQNEEIKLEQKTLNAVLNQMTDAVIIVDGDGFVQLSNPSAERMFRFNKEDFVEKTIVEVLRNHQLYALWQECRMDHTQKETTVEIVSHKMFVQAIAKPLDEIFPDGVLMVIQDFTRIRQLEKIRSDFVSNVSHELRTPIASIKALSDTLQEGALDDPPAAKRFLNRMDVEIDNLTQLVQELLELSKIESGRVPLKKVQCHPKYLVDKAIERMQVQAERSGLNLNSDIPNEISEVSADPDRIGQVFVNLIHNAIKFTSPGGSILVQVVENQNDIVFCIKDTGSGIEKESLTRIFERFYKTDRARSSGGTGLGLSITKHLIDAHNGRVWVESTPGIGSSFFFSIPKA